MPSYIRPSSDIERTRESGKSEASEDAVRSTEHKRRIHPRSPVPGYTIEAILGRGGMGIVYRARDEQLKRSVAIKMLLAAAHADSSSRQRLRREAELVARLVHPSIVQIHKIGEHEGLPYVVLELVEGGDLNEAVRTLQPVRSIAQVLRDVARAVAFAHEKGIVHRDIKPSNILLYREPSSEELDELGSHPTGLDVSTVNLRGTMLASDNRREAHWIRSPTAVGRGNSQTIPTPKIADFGLARPVDDASDMTRTGDIMGTPNYMAPEQARGLSKDVGPLADVYSLGAVLYATLVGHPPFVGSSSADILEQVKNKEPIAPSKIVASIPKDLETICLKCLEKNPTLRYQSANEFADELSRFLSDEPICARPISRFERAWRWYRRNPLVSALATSLVVVTVVLAVLGPWFAYNQMLLRGQADALFTQTNTLLNKQVGLVSQLEKANRNEKEALKNANASAASLHQHLVNMHITQGNLKLDADDPISALPWYAAALALDQGDPVREWGHRVRLASVMRDLPKPIWVHQTAFEQCTPVTSPDGKWIAIGGLGDVSIFETSQGKMVHHLRSGRVAEVDKLQFSADSQRLIESRNSDIWLWNVVDGKPIGPNRKLSAPVDALSLNHQGTEVVVALKDGTTSRIDLMTGKTIRAYPRLKSRVTQLDVDWERNRLLSVTRLNVANLYFLDVGKLVATLSHDQPINWGEIDPTGKHIVTASEDRSVRLWNLDDGEPVGEPIVHPDRVRVARFDRSGTRIGTGGWDSTARVFDVTTRRLISGPMSHANSISHLDFSGDGKLLVTASHDHTARIWDTQTGRPVAPPIRHGFVVHSVNFLPDSSRLLTASNERVVRLWELEHQRQSLFEVRHRDVVNSARFTPDGQRFVAASKDGIARVYDAHTGEPLPWEIAQGNEIRDADFSPDGQFLFTTTTDGIARIWRVSDGSPVTGELRHSGIIWQAEFSPDGSQFVTASELGGVLWNVADGTELRRFVHASKKKNHSARWVKFGPNGKLLLTGGVDATAIVWDVATGRPIGRPLEHADSVEGGGFSPDGCLVVTASRDHTARIWTVATSEASGPPLVHAAGVHNATFSFDGQFVLTGARDGTARLWTVSNSSPATPPMSIGTGMVRAQFSPNQKYVVTTGGKDARLWNAHSGRFLGTIFPHDDWVKSARVSPDSKLLLTASEDGSVRVWSIPEPIDGTPESLVQLAELISGHRADPSSGLVPLTPTELESRYVEWLGKRSLVNDVVDESKVARELAPIDLKAFRSTTRHWRDLRDTNRFIQAIPDQPSYRPEDVREIAANIMLFQRKNGGWPKDYDMTAILTDEQRSVVESTRDRNDSSYDNDNIHSQVDYLARAYSQFPDPSWRAACERGLDFIFASQNSAGGFPQRFPDPHGIAAYITFNDNVTIGILNVLQDAVERQPHFDWLDPSRRSRASSAVAKGIECILKTQLVVDGVRTGWCQQYDQVTYEPRSGRPFEPAAICPQETTEIVKFLRRQLRQTPSISLATDSALIWLKLVQLNGIRVERIAAPREEFDKHSAEFDVVVTQASKAPPLWARYYEIGTNLPIFVGRDGVIKYSLAEIERERRTGTAWYGKWPLTVQPSAKR